MNKKLISKLADSIAEELEEEVPDVASPSITKDVAEVASDEEMESKIKSAYPYCSGIDLSIGLQIYPPNLEIANKEAKNLEQIIVSDSKKVPEALEKSQLKLYKVDIPRSYTLSNRNGSLYIMASINILRNESQSEDFWKTTSSEVVKKFGYK